MNISQNVLQVLDSVLALGGRTTTFGRETALLDAVPELDSMAVVSLITALEEHFGMVIDDEDIEGATFATVGSLSDFIGAKLAN